MELNEYTINIGRRAVPIELCFIGDIHYGTRDCDVRKLTEIVDWIGASDHRYWAGVGDYTEGITPRDKRFNPGDFPPEMRATDLANLLPYQTDQLTKYLEPIKHRCIGLAHGNHELKARQMCDQDSTKRLCQNLGAKFLGWTSITRLNIKRAAGPVTNINILIEHSLVSGRKNGGKLNRVQDRVSDWYDVDMIIWGHSHHRLAGPKEQLWVPKKGKMRLTSRKVHCGIVPSFYNTYQIGSTSYGEVAGYSPSSTGILLSTIVPFKTRIIDGVQEEYNSIHMSV